jgi:hypothetical protein
MTSSLRRHEPLVLLLVGAIAGALGLRRTLRRRRASDSSPAAEQAWTCACGEEYRVVGTGRHRVLWPARGNQEDAVMSGECSNCGRSLEG